MECMKWVLTLPNKKQCYIKLERDEPEKSADLWEALAKYDEEHKTHLYNYILTDDRFEADPDGVYQVPPISDDDMKLLQDRFFAYNPGIHMLDGMVEKAEEIIKLAEAVKQPVQSLYGLQSDIQDMAAAAGDADYIRETAMFYMWAKARAFNGKYDLDEVDFQVIQHLSSIFIECARIGSIFVHLREMSTKTGKDAAKNGKSAKWWKEMNDLANMTAVISKRVEKIKTNLENDKKAYSDLKVKE